MNTVAEITETLPKLSDPELREVERALIQAYRDRKSGILFDDAYGTFTEEDLAVLQDEALRVIDGEPPKP